MKQTVYFKILWNKNKNVYCEGYVDIPSDECEDEEIDWYYWTNNGYQLGMPFYWHDEEEITGMTDKQNNEINCFYNDYMEDALWIDTTIIQSNENDKNTFVREKCTLIIGNN